eukprot:gene33257-44522_t
MTDDKGIEKLLSDLHCGSGQWKNIQQIVRAAFQSCFSKVKEQEKKFEALSNEISSINGKLNERLKKDELRQYLNFHLHTGDYHQKVTNDLASQLHELKRNINLRSSPSSSSSSTNGRTQELADRVMHLEKIFKEESSNSSSATEIPIQRMNKSIEELRHKYDRLSQHTVDMKDEIRAATTIPALQGLRNKVDEIYGLLGDYYSKEQLKVLLDTKADKARVDSMLILKVDKSVFESSLSSLDLAINRHEQSIASIRVKLSDRTLFGADSSIGAKTTMKRPSKAVEPVIRDEEQGALIGDRGRTEGLL